MNINIVIIYILIASILIALMDYIFLFRNSRYKVLIFSHKNDIDRYGNCNTSKANMSYVRLQILMKYLKDTMIIKQYTHIIKYI